jgi:serine/threonine protein kinase/tetratricopeptide (TPR) repeat protein
MNAGRHPASELGKYELLCLLATGGMAAVHLARANGIGGFEKLLVIKRILPRAAGDQSFIQMFLKEARLAATLEHSNIAHVFDVGAVHNDVFLAMEFLHGHDVRSIQRQVEGALPLEPALAILVGACRGLHYAHEKRGPCGEALGLVHRDVSPSNVVVTFDGGVKVIDFGIAKATNRDGETRSGVLKGKPGYMSPEQCLGVPLDRRSDLFCVGIMLHELTTGHRLFVASDGEYLQLKAIVEAIVPAPSTLVAGYPPELDRIVMKSLARSASDRYASALELQTDIERFARDQRLDISPTGLTRFMSATFHDELAAWRKAEQSGVSLAEHVMSSLVGPTSLGRIAMPEGVTTMTDTPEAAARRGAQFASTQLAAAEPSSPEAVEVLQNARPPDGAPSTGNADGSTLGAKTLAIPVSAGEVRRRRRWGRGLAAALTLSVAAAGVAFALRWERAGLRERARSASSGAQSSSSAPSPAPRNAPYVLVFRFENRTTDPVFDGTLELILESALKRSPVLYPLAGSTIRLLASEVAPNTEIGDDDLGRVVSEKTRRRVAVVRGSVDSEGVGYAITFHATDGANGAPIVSSTIQVAAADGVAGAVTDFARRLRAEMGDPPQPADVGRMGLSTSMEANHEFVVGRSDLGAGKLGEAADHLQHALDLDPHFSVAAGVLGTALLNAGRVADAQERFRVSMAAETGSMSDRERLLWTAQYHMSRDEFAESAKAHEELLARWPADTRYLTNLASVYFQAGDFPRALSLAERALLEHSGSPAVRANVVSVEVVSGQFQEAADHGQKAFSEMPRSLPMTYAFTAIAEVMLGHRADALQILERMRQVDASQEAASESDFAAMEGRLSDAATLLEGGLRLDEEHKAVADAEKKWAALAEVRFRQGNEAGARAAADRASGSSEVVTLYRAARVLVRVRAWDKVAKLARKVADLPGSRARLYGSILSALVLSGHEKTDLAQAALKAAANESDAWILHAEIGMMDLDKGALADAERELSKCVERRGEGLSAFLDDTTSAAYLPPVYYALARAKERLHEVDAAETFKAMLALDHGADDPLARDALRRSSQGSR